MTDDVVVEEQAYPVPTKNILSRLIARPEAAGVIGIIVFFVLFTSLDSSMARPDNIVRILTTASYMGVAGIGMMFLMMAGEIDISSGATAGLCSGSTAGYLAAVHGWPEWASLSAGLGVALTIGLVNSFITLKVRMPAFFTTLGTSFVQLGLITLIVRGRYWVTRGLFPLLEKLGTPSPIFALPWNVVFWLALMLLADFAVRRTKIGPLVSATGGNKRAYPGRKCTSVRRKADRDH